MEFSRSLSSKRSIAAIELCPSGLTERQMLQLALEESKNAALAAQAAADKSAETSDEEDSESDCDDGSSARGAKAFGGKARRAKCKQKAHVQKPSDQKFACSTPRKRARVELAEIRTATSSENSKASRSTQLRDLVGGAFGDHQGQAQPCGAMSMAADNRESDNSEHQSGSGDQHSMCRQAAHDAAASPSIKVEATEGAGETETSPRESRLKSEQRGLLEECNAPARLKEEPLAQVGKGSAEESKPPTGLKVKGKKSGLAIKRPGTGLQRPAALIIPARSDKTAELGSADPEVSKKGRAPGSRAPRTASRTPCSKGSHWASHLNSPVGPTGRRLRSAVVEEMKHNMERNEAFAWQPQTPARQRTSSLSGACALLSKLSSHFLGSLTRESSQVLTQSHSGGQLSEVSTPRRSPQPGSPKWLSPISEVGNSPLQMASWPSLAGELPCALQSAVSAELAPRLGGSHGSPAAASGDQEQADFMTPKGSTPPLEFPVAAMDASCTPTLIMPPAEAPAFGFSMPLKKLHSGKLQLSTKAGSGPAPKSLPIGVGWLARQASADLKARHDLETKRLELSAEAINGAGAAASKPCSDMPTVAAAHGSRLGKALKAMQLGTDTLPPKASFQASCGRLLKPFECAKDAPAWKAPPTLRTSPSGGCLSISPHLAKQREQRNLQNTWDDLLARQQLELAAAEHLAEWALAALPGQPAGQA